MSVSSFTGVGFTELLEAVETATMEYETCVAPHQLYICMCDSDRDDCSDSSSEYVPEMERVTKQRVGLLFYSS